MTDACCGGQELAGPPPARLRDVAEIRAAMVAGAALGVGLVAGWVGAGTISAISLAGAVVVGGSTFVPQSLRALVRGRLSVGTLMAVAAIGAVALGELGEAATLAFLFSISEALESYALARTRHGLRALLDLVPAQATVLVDGRSALNLSAISGESVPVERGPGDEVYAAAINGRAALEIEVTAATEDTRSAVFGTPRGPDPCPMILRYLHRPHRPWHVAARGHPVPQLVEVVLSSSPNSVMLTASTPGAPLLARTFSHAS